jgi:DNA-binding beta-propeller fold protein YncE
MHLRLTLFLLTLFLPLIAEAADPVTPTSAYRILERVPGPDGDWDYAIVDPETRRLYIARSYGVQAIDLDRSMVATTLVAGHDVRGIAAIGSSGRFVTANDESDSATIFDGKTGQVVVTVRTGQHPDAVVFEPKSGLVVVMNHTSGDATIIDPVKLANVGSIRIGGTLEFAAANNKGLVYVNVENKNKIAVLDVHARRVAGAIALLGCHRPTGLAYDATDDWLMSTCSNGITKVVDATTGREIGSAKTGKSPDAAIWDPERGVVFVPSAADGSLTVVAVTKGTAIHVVQRLMTQVGTRTGAFDRKTGRVYLPASKFGPPDKPGGYPVPLPGTFTLLVVGIN